MVAEGFAEAFELGLVVHLHAAGIGGDAEVVGDEDDQRLRVRRAEVAVDFGELVFFGAAGVELFEIANEDDLEWSHERGRAGAVEDFKDGVLGQVQF